MYPEIETLLYKAEDHYLQPLEVELFRRQAQSLAQRLETYELVREQEIAIFQPIADQLLEIYPQQEKAVERALKHWLTVWRYCAMAMLLNNSEFLQQRLLEWLTELVQARQTLAIETSLYQLLQRHLQELLSEEQWGLLQPFLEQAKTSLSKTDNLN